MIPIEALRKRAEALHLYGLLAHWSELTECAWVEPLLTWEETARARRSLERRLAEAHIGRFKPLADFDWDWPEQCDRAAINELMGLEFLTTASNAILVGTSGLGKSTIARNIAHRAVLSGHTVLFATAGQLLGDLAAIDSDSALRRRLRHYAAPALLVIDEVGYLSYSTCVTASGPTTTWRSSTYCERNAAAPANLSLPTTAQPTTGVTNHRSERRRPVKLQGATIGPFLVDSNRQPFSAMFARQLSAVPHSHQHFLKPTRVVNDNYLVR